VPVTLTTPGSPAGKVTSALPLLPAAATISTPFERAYPRAEAIPSSRPLITKLKLMRRAPWSAAQTIPSVMSAALPLPSGPITFTGMTEQREHAPTPPIPLFDRAATTPATSVP
jgi:hypothetical protein